MAGGRMFNLFVHVCIGLILNSFTEAAILCPNLHHKTFVQRSRIFRTIYSRGQNKSCRIFGKILQDLL